MSKFTDEEALELVDELVPVEYQLMITAAALRKRGDEYNAKVCERAADYIKEEDSDKAALVGLLDQIIAVLETQRGKMIPVNALIKALKGEKQ